MLPPDARLPDGSTYTGEMNDGLFHGEGVQTFPNGKIYTGEFQEGYWHGQGELDSPAGWHYKGGFEQGLMSGQGVLEDQNSRYEGGFLNDEFHGQGRYEFDGDVYKGEFVDGELVQGRHITDYGTYEGEFQDWYYHGEGTFYPKTSGGIDSLSGTWEHGEYVSGNSGEQYVGDRPSEEDPGLLTERILAEDHQRLQQQIASLADERPGITDAYFLAVGGDGTESVFMRDIDVAKNGVQAQFDIANRSIALLNHRDYETYPLATRPAIATALKALGQKMNPEEDLLVIHLVSHGGRDGTLLIQQPGVELPDLSPREFADMLAPLDVRRKLMVISACFSGHWLNELEDPDSMILTSAREDRTSFGCGDDSEMTWFTKAVYQTVGLSLDKPEAMFEQIDQQIRTWEKEIGMEQDQWSHPQFHIGDDFRLWLDQNLTGEQRGQG